MCVGGVGGLLPPAASLNGFSATHSPAQCSVGHRVGDTGGCGEVRCMHRFVGQNPGLV